DLAVNGADGVSIYYGNGDGSFGPPEAAGVKGYPIGVDVNRDGKLDLVVADAEGNCVLVLVNQGARAFAQPAPYAVGNMVEYPSGSYPQHVAAGDFNEDGWPDLVVACTNSHEIDVLMNRGDGTFEAPS